MPKIVPASLWTRKDLKEFKNGLRKSKENVISVPSLGTATVSVNNRNVLFAPKISFLHQYPLVYLQCTRLLFVVSEEIVNMCVTCISTALSSCCLGKSWLDMGLLGLI